MLEHQEPWECNHKQLCFHRLQWYPPQSGHAPSTSLQSPFHTLRLHGWCDFDWHDKRKPCSSSFSIVWGPLLHVLICWVSFPKRSQRLPMIRKVGLCHRLLCCSLQSEWCIRLFQDVQHTSGPWNHWNMFSSLIPQDALDFHKVSWLHNSKICERRDSWWQWQRNCCTRICPQSVCVRYWTQIWYGVWTSPSVQAMGTCCELFDSSCPSSKTCRRDFLNFDEDNPRPSVLSREVPLPNFSWLRIEVWSRKEHNDGLQCNLR